MNKFKIKSETGNILQPFLLLCIDDKSLTQIPCCLDAKTCVIQLSFEWSEDVEIWTS